MKPLRVCLLGALLLIPLLVSSVWADSTPLAWDDARQLYTLELTRSSQAGLQYDTVDLAIEYTSAYPGSEDFLVTVSMKSPIEIAAFMVDFTMSRPDLVNFSTVGIYVDSMDTCPEPEEYCWDYIPVRECLALPGEVIEDWHTFLAFGEVGDTTRPDCKYLRVLGWDLGSPIPPQPEYVPLFQFGVDILCVPDSLSERTVTFFLTGELSDPTGGYLVPYRPHFGDLTVLLSVPGDASSDSLVDVADVVFLLNYLYKGGDEPCVMEAADPNADCQVDLGDVVYLLGFLYREGAPPQPGCAH